MRIIHLFKRSMAVMMIAAVGYASAAAAAVEHASAATESSQSLISSGKDYLGTPYRMGAVFKNGEPVAFDCSSFTQYLFLKHDIKLPRTSSEQAKVGVKVDKANLSQGDLVFFRTNGKSISHVGIYAGDGKMLHASSSKGITITNMHSSYWKKRYVTARRVLS